jgi:hypothetical protein
LSAADDHGVDAEHLAVQVDERPAGVPWVDAGIGLQVVLDRIDADPTASFRAHDPGRHGVAEPERRADRDDPFADPHRVAIGKLRGDEVLRVDANEGEIRRGVAPYQTRGQEPPVAKAHGDGERVFDDVIVRQDGAIAVEDDAGPHSALHRCFTRARRALVPTHRLRRRLAYRDFDLHDARAHLLGDRGETFGQAARLHRRGKVSVRDPGRGKQRECGEQSRVTMRPQLARAHGKSW